MAAPFQTWEGEEIHPDPFDKAALLLRGITQGHPFADGNKRAGLLVAAYYLELMGYPTPNPFDQDAVVTFCFSLAAGGIRSIEAIASQLREWWARPEVGTP
jgi:death on curing protein